MTIPLDIRYVVVFILILVGVLFLIFTYLIVKRLIEDSKERKKKHYIKKYRNELFQYLLNNDRLSRNLIPTTSWKIDSIEEMLNCYVKNIKSESIISRISEYAELHLTAYYRKCLKSRRWSIRMNALYYIVEFQIQSLVHDIEAMLQNEKKYSRDERFQMYRALIKLSDSNINHLFFTENTTFSEYEYRKLLIELSEEQIHELLTSEKELPYELMIGVIDIIGLKKLEQFTPFLEERLQDDDLEVRIQVLKAFNEFTMIYNIENLLPFIDSDHWQERMLIARLLEKMEREEAERYLLELMKDSSWWVRSQAARTLLSFKDGKKTLGMLIKNSDDRFAADMAEEVLKKVY